MSLKDVTKALRGLSYMDMLTLAKMINNQLPSDPLTREHDIAQLLAEIEFKPGEANEMELQEEQLLQTAFNRNRSVNISFDKVQKSWHLNCTTLPGSQVVSMDLRSAFPKMLDQIITMEALQANARR